MEDMDLSLRTYVNGWKAIYLTDTTCINEVGKLQFCVSAMWTITWLMRTAVAPSGLD